MPRKCALVLVLTFAFCATLAVATEPPIAPTPVPTNEPPTFIIQEPIKAPADAAPAPAAPAPAPAPKPAGFDPCAVDPCASPCVVNQCPVAAPLACPVADVGCEEAPQKKKREHFTVCDYWEILKACLYCE